jgi:hypothetical protein
VDKEFFMIHSENLTNRELLQNAMPLVSLSRSQWNELMKHIDELEIVSGVESDLFKAIETLTLNQMKIEVINNYRFYYNETLDSPVRKESFSDLIL